VYVTEDPEQRQNAYMQCFGQVWQSYYEKGRHQFPIKAVILHQSIRYFQKLQKKMISPKHLAMIHGDKNLSKYHL
jgi:hypothetical protein